MPKIMVGYEPPPKFPLDAVMAKMDEWAAEPKPKPTHACVGFRKVGPSNFNDWLENEVLQLLGEVHDKYDPKTGSGWFEVPVEQEEAVRRIVMSWGELTECD